jgi:hypothetical protein
MVMVALAAVLLVSLVYLSMQGGGREGMAGAGAKPKPTTKEKFGCKKETMKPHGENFAGRAGKEGFVTAPGKCSKSVYTNKANCEANSGTWTLD